MIYQMIFILTNFSDGEFAWTNFNCPAKCFDYRYYGNLQGKSSLIEKDPVYYEQAKKRLIEFQRQQVLF